MEPELRRLSITSDEVNYLIYRYLQESGFSHSSFAFANESYVSRCNFDSSKVQPGALIHFLQKGLQFCQIETHLRDDGRLLDCNEPFSLVAPHVCGVSAKDMISELEPLDDSVDFKEDDVMQVHGHAAETFVQAWNPHQRIISSGSSDATVRLWRVPPSTSTDAKLDPVAVLMHGETVGEKSKDVTALDWNSNGTLLATGSYDGPARVWTSEGTLLRVLTGHKAAISSLRWNPKGNYLLTASVDKSSIIWDSEVGVELQKLTLNNAPMLDCDWRDNVSFACCSTDRSIYYCELGKSEAVRVFEGHSNEVNAVKWDPSGRVLASCSDDTTVKLWEVTRASPMLTLTGHKKEVYSVRWSPTGPNTANPNKSQMIASCSFDGSIRLWDAATGKCEKSLERHTEPVYAASFNETGDMIASGSFDNTLLVWSVKDGSVIRRYRGTAGIFDCSWSGDQISFCASDGTVTVVNVKV